VRATTAPPPLSARVAFSQALTQTEELPEGEEKVRAVRAMFDTIAPRYDLVNRIMTFGLDRTWRRRAVIALDLVRGSSVVDLACGTGDLCRDLTRAGLCPLGVDFSLGMLRHARTDAPLAQGDATAVPLAAGSVDGFISGFALRNFVSLPEVFSEMARVIRPGGRVALLDVATPANLVLRAGHAVYFGRVVPRIGGALSDPAAYRYLPKSVAYLPAGDGMLEMLEAAGFGAVRRQMLTGGITQLITATRKVLS
jgi:demethylmenaquinone methyltransferase/2-methoxy-6-polyprenyl-1,4-benzoquinol methylase